MPTALSDAQIRQLSEGLSRANRKFAEAYPGDRTDRQPVHTVYGGAQLFSHDITHKLGAAARRTFEEYAPDAETLARAVTLPREGGLADVIHARVREKLGREPIEDYRIDFEDGYGNRPDVEEDGHAEAAAEGLARGIAEGTLPAFIGIRIKPLSEELRTRSLRTLDLVLTSVMRKAGRLPERFVVTLPKITALEQVATLADALDLLERANGLAAGAVPIELMVETPQSIFTPEGGLALPGFVAAARGRCRGAHFGTYDYTASVNITAAYQLPQHPACDFARHVMQVSLAGTGVTLSDGATTVMPVGPHRVEPGGTPLTPAQRVENARAVHRAWKLHYDDVRSSLRHAYYQGWDLNPAQLPTRFAAVFTFFLEGRTEAGERLRRFVDRAAQASMLGNIFDDAATGQGLLNYFLRGLSCGALTESEALATGLTLDELRGRSFVKILNARGVRVD